jgi:hypothetical protein
VGQAARELRQMWRKRYRYILDSIFEEFASNKTTIRPDEAMELMKACLEKMANDGKRSDDATSGPAYFQFDFVAYRREAHHYAVDRFYKTYYPRKRGAPPLPDTYLDRILRLRLKGPNYISIAEKLGQPQEKMRKQVEAAEKRWQEAVARIEQLKLRFPHMVAPDPRVKEKQQLKQQNVEARTGK